MKSPYLSGGGAPNFGPPPGLASIMGGREANQAQDRQGASRNISTIMGYLQNLGADSERQKKEDKAALAVYDAMEPDEGEDGSIKPHPFGLTRDQLTGMSRPDRIAYIGGRVQAETLKGALAEQKQRGEEMLFRKQESQQRLAEAMRQQTADTRFASMAEGLPITRALQEGRGPIRPGPTTIEDLLQAARSNPTAPSARPLMQELMRSDGGSVMPVEVNVGGSRLAINPRSGALIKDLTAQPAQKPVPDGFVPLSSSVDEDGNVTTRWGLPPEDRTKLPSPADQAFFANAEELQAKLDGLDKVIDEFGNYENMNAEAKAKLLQYPYALAVNYAKVVDPNSVAREGEVAAAQKYMIPMGLFTRNEVTKAAVKSMRDELSRRVKSYNASQSPTAIRDAAAGEPGRFDSEQAARSSGAKAGDVIELYDPATATYRKFKLH